MKRYRLLDKFILLVLLGSVVQAHSDGFYVGVDGALLSFKKDSMKVEKSDKSRTTYHDIKSSHYGALKVGYQHFKHNRVELYFRKNKLDSREGDITLESYGVNYEWGFSSLSTQSLMPYLAVGVGVGKSSSDELEPIDNVGIGEVSFDIGVHYQFTTNIDAQIGYRRINTIFDNLDDYKDDEVSAIGQNSFILALTYKF